MISVSKENSKQVKSAGGSMLNFVNRHWALRKGYLDLMNFDVTHPLNKEFVLINSDIKRF